MNRKHTGSAMTARQVVAVVFMLVIAAGLLALGVALSGFSQSPAVKSIWVEWTTHPILVAIFFCCAVLIIIMMLRPPRSKGGVTR